MLESTSHVSRNFKIKLAVIAVIAFLTLTFFALGFTALEEANSASAGVQQTAGGSGDNAAVSVFKWV